MHIWITASTDNISICTFFRCHAWSRYSCKHTTERSASSNQNNTDRPHADAHIRFCVEFLVIHHFQIVQNPRRPISSVWQSIRFSSMRLIFSFTLVCIIHQWQKYVYLTAYFITFVPLLDTFSIFVLPADIYKTEFKKIFEQMYRKWRRRHI